MKKWMYMLMVVMLALPGYGQVTRDIGAETNILTYSSDEATGTPSKMYWAVREIIPSGCTVTSISGCSSDIGGCGDSYQVWYNLYGNEVRVVVATPDGGGAIASSIELSLSGTGTCTLNNGYYAESRSGGNVDTEPQVLVYNEVSIDLDVSGYHDADLNQNHLIEFNEFVDWANLWLAGQGVTFDDFVYVANAWLTQLFI